MANHGYISVKKKINPEILGEALREISEKRFDGSSRSSSTISP